MINASYLELYLKMSSFTNNFQGTTNLEQLLYKKSAKYWAMPNYKDALSGLRQFLATKSHLKPMNNAFYFPLFPYKFFSNFLVN